MSETENNFSDTRKFIVDKHLSYFKNDVGLNQLAELEELENLIRYNFLFKVDHDKKFYFKETYDIFNRSIMHSLDDKSPGAGFKAIARYANNLYIQPWRKEFQTLRTYSGYYQHEVHENLVDGEQLFFKMGYERSDVDKDLLTLVPDNLKHEQLQYVSLDALTASVECVIIQEIYSNIIQSQSPMNITLDYVCRVRQDNRGSIDESFNFILNEIHRSNSILAETSVRTTSF